jgi:hypothetical protein
LFEAALNAFCGMF